MNDALRTIRETVEYHPDSDTYRATYANEQIESVSRAVVSVLSEATETDPMELEPIHAAVDPDALDALFQQTMTAGHHGEGHVTFTHEGTEVTVHSYGVIAVRPEATDGGGKTVGR
jgi:hypothetical protein